MIGEWMIGEWMIDGLMNGWMHEWING